MDRLTYKIIPDEFAENPRKAFGNYDDATYQAWRNGDVWGYVISHPLLGEIESLWGCYGYDYCVREAENALKSITPSHLINLLKNKIEKFEAEIARLESRRAERTEKN